MKLRNPSGQRRGVASLLAMIYLVLFAVLSVGFYASATMNAQVTHNEAKASHSLLAAESGLDFMRYYLAQVVIPPATPPANVLLEVCGELESLLNGTGNLGANVVDIVGNEIHVPKGGNQFVSLNDGRQFRAVISQQIVNTGDPKRPQDVRLCVKVIGAYQDSAVNDSARAVQLTFNTDQYDSPVLDYGVASRGSLSMNSNARVQGFNNDGTLGDVLLGGTAVPTLTMDSNSYIQGMVSISNATGTINGLGSSQINGGAASTALASGRAETGVGLPEFPTIDTSIYKPYATNVLNVPGKKYDTGSLSNILIKANTNPIFDSNIQIYGVVYIETPNIVTFNSNTTIRGVIAVQNNPTGNYLSNRLIFDSNARIYGPDTLDPNVYGTLTQLTGSAILAPKFQVTINSNFDITGGSLIAGKITMDSNARGTISGNVVTLDNTPLLMNGNAELTFKSNTALPTGVYFHETLAPDFTSYEEVSAK